MFYRAKIKDHIRVPPDHFGNEVKDAITKMIRKNYEGFISPELGFVIDVGDIYEIGEGIVIPGDGASYYEATFDLFVFKPELQEVLLGRVRDIADFGAFVDLGACEGMVHVSQSMDDFVSFAKEKVLTGKNTGRVLKVGDKVRTRIIAVSFKDIASPKLGLTMRQEGLGKLEWFGEEVPPKKGKKEKKEEKEAKE
ncbi:MAG: DNA-directed RNA polymerase [Candidatus Woesearchaeota archaeon]